MNNMENNDTESWKFEYELRRFVDRVTRWPLIALKAGITADTPFWPFQDIIEHGRENYELFSTQLRSRLSKVKNWKPFAIDLHDRFLVGIKYYYDWYDKNKNEINDLELNHIFDTMNSLIDSTEREIYKYFPELKTSEKPISENLTGFFLGYSEPQLEKLFELLRINYLGISTTLEHFKNAFNGKDLEPNFKPIKWKSKTKGAIIINFLLRKERELWQITSKLIEPANYDQLLYQIKEKAIFKTVTDDLSDIEKTIKTME